MEQFVSSWSNNLQQLRGRVKNQLSHEWPTCHNCMAQHQGPWVSLEYTVKTVRISNTWSNTEFYSLLVWFVCLFVCLLACLVGWFCLFACLLAWLFVCLLVWFVCLVGWLVGLFVSLFVCLFVCLFGWLVGWLGGWPFTTNDVTIPCAGGHQYSINSNNFEKHSSSLLHQGTLNRIHNVMDDFGAWQRSRQLEFSVQTWRCRRILMELFSFLLN